MILPVNFYRELSLAMDALKRSDVAMYVGYVDLKCPSPSESPAAMRTRERSNSMMHTHDVSLEISFLCEFLVTKLTSKT